MSNDTQVAFHKANCILNNIKNHNGCPEIIKLFINGIQWAIEKFGKINTDTNQQGSICNIY